MPVVSPDDSGSNTSDDHCAAHPLEKPFHHDFVDVPVRDPEVALGDALAAIRGGHVGAEDADVVDALVRLIIPCSTA